MKSNHCLVALLWYLHVIADSTSKSYNVKHKALEFPRSWNVIPILRFFFSYETYPTVGNYFLIGVVRQNNGQTINFILLILRLS